MARMDECLNFLVVGKCDPWIISRSKNDEFVGGQDDLILSDGEITDEICFNCPHFRSKGRPFVAQDL
ncbi:MAG: hypothetical protein ACOWYE_01815 [Desulfatiglandales bacterium]